MLPYIQPVHFLGCGLTTWLTLIGTVVASFMPAWGVPAGFRRAFPGIAAVLLGALLLGRMANDLLLLREGPSAVWDADVQAVAGAWLNGQALYPRASDGLFYGLLYGPLLYEILALAQRCFGIGSPLAALPGMAAELLAIAVTWRAARRMGVTPAAALFGSAAMLAMLCAYYPSNGMRSDPFLVLLAALALATLPALERGARHSAFGLGLCAGLSVTCKFTAGFYAAPALLCALLRPGAGRPALLAAALLGGATGATVPYLLPGAGVIDHWRFLTELRPVELFPALLLRNLVFLVAFLLPVLAYRPGLPAPPDYRLLAGLLMSLVPTFFVAATDGTGFWHFLPFLPPVVLLLGRVVDAEPRFGFRQMAFLPVIGILAVGGLFQQVKEIRRNLVLAPEQGATRLALAAFLADHPGARVAIGPSSGEPAKVGDEWAMPLQAQTARLVGTGQPLAFTLWGWLDMRTSEHAVRLGDAQFAICRADFWLTRSGDPFPSEFMLGDQVAQAFHSAYLRIGRTPAFDIWGCRAPAPPARTR